MYSRNRTKMVLLQFLCLTLCSLTAAEFNAFEENLLFKINWPGPIDLLDAKQEENSVLMTTVDNEQYKCVLPDTSPSYENEDEVYSGPSALELLRPLLAKDSCIYKLDLYWAYELCHGSHLKQFHEEKEAGKPVSIQEYYLGRYDPKQFDKDVEQFAQTNSLESVVQQIKMEGHYFPYVTLNMTDGTVCDLNGQARVTRVKYICYPEMKHQIYSLEEISTCEYEVLVVTYLLCKHPDYSMKVPITNEIRCHALEATPLRPIVLEELEQESYELNPEDDKWEAFKKQFQSSKEPVTIPPSTPDKVESSAETVTPYDSKLVNDFLSGEHCLYGGTGWWKYEFCYGRKVEQYHQDAGGSKNIISLGTWNKEKHLQWLTKNPHKKPKLESQRKQLSHFYSEGDQCAETGGYRHVEVRLKCKDSSNHPNAVTMVLLEPSTCEYILLVESPILCSLLPKANENGLIDSVVEQ